MHILSGATRRWNNEQRSERPVAASKNGCRSKGAVPCVQVGKNNTRIKGRSSSLKKKAVGKDAGSHVEPRQEWGEAWGGMQALISRSKVFKRKRCVWRWG